MTTPNWRKVELNNSENIEVNRHYKECIKEGYEVRFITSVGLGGSYTSRITHFIWMYKV